MTPNFIQTKQDNPVTLADIVQDINWTITDIETLAIELSIPKGMTSQQFKEIQDSLKRSVGQLKAARAAVIRANRSLGASNGSI